MQLSLNMHNSDIKKNNKTNPHNIQFKTKTINGDLNDYNMKREKNKIPYLGKKEI